MTKLLIILFTVIPYPLRRDLRTNFYRYYLLTVNALRSGDIKGAEEFAGIAYNTVRDQREAFLALYMLGTIKAYEGEWPKARYYLENALEIADAFEDSTLIEPWLLYVTYYDNGLYAAYKLARDFNTGIREERFYKSLYFVSEGRYDDALSVLRNIDGDNVSYIKSYIFYKKGLLDSSLYYISKLSEFNNVEKTFYATLLYLSGDFDRAHEIIKQVEKTDVYSVLLQSVIESNLGDEELLETYTRYRDILADKPEFTKITLMVAGMLFNRRKYRRVVDILENTISVMKGKERKRALFLLGTSYVYLRRYANAVKIWNEYLENDSILYDYAHFQLGRSAYELELDSIAKEHLIRLHDTSAYYYWGLYLYARVLMKEELYQLAEPILYYISKFPVERSLKRRVYYNLGKISVQKHQWDSAQINFKNMLELGFKGSDVDSAEYLYEYSKLQMGEYANPVDLNMAFSRKYPENPMVPRLLDEVITYFLASRKLDSAFMVLVRRRNFVQDSVYRDEFREFVNLLRERDSNIVDSLIDIIKDKGTDFEKLTLAQRLINIKRAGEAIGILQNITGKNKRVGLLLIAEAYDSMGKMEEKNLVLRDIFPPFDSIGEQAFVRLAIDILNTQGMDSFYNLVLDKNIPDSLQIKVLQMASNELLSGGDTLNALELKSRLKEITGGKDAVEEN